jgi:hypothetical protein
LPFRRPAVSVSREGRAGRGRIGGEGLFHPSG